MKKLFSRNFLLLWQGQFVSKIGTFLFDIALILWIKKYTNSAGLISLILIASNTPEIFLAPIGGTLADIFPRKRIIIIADFISGILIIGISIVIALNLFSNSINLVLLFLLSLALGICGSCFSPAVSALIPQLVEEKHLHSANSLFQSTSQLSMIIGQGIGGVLFLKLGAAMLFCINGISYILSGISELFIKIEEKHHNPENTWQQHYQQFLGDFKQGFRYCWSNPQLKYLLFIIGIYHFFIAPLPILLPFWISDTLGLNEKWLGFLFAGFAAGILAGLTIAGLIDFSTKNISRIVLTLFLLSSLLFIGFGVFPQFYISLACLVLLGMIIGTVVVIHITFIQKLTDSAFHGRVFGFLNTITNASVPIGLGIYGLILDMLNKLINTAVAPQIIFIANGILVFLIMFVIILKVNLKSIFAERTA